MHDYLDRYNYILDVEFTSIKQVLYPTYWKIGIGILKYEYGDIRYVLFPVEYQKEQTLIKEVALEDSLDVGLINGSILVLVYTKDNEEMRRFPLQTAYKSLESKIIKKAATYNLPITDDFIAHEYLVSFIDCHCVYLNMEAKQSSYQLQGLKYMLHVVLPMYEATNKSHADWVREDRYNVDSRASMMPSETYKRRLKECEKKIEAGFIPTVKVSLVSEQYNIELINYYIRHLENQGYKSADRKYRSNQHDTNIIGVNFKKTWNTEVLWENVKLFFDQFYRLYNKYIFTHFPSIKHELQLLSPPSYSIVHLLITDPSKGGPYLEIYQLRPHKPEPGKLYYYTDTDIDNPINRENYFVKQVYSCTIDDKGYELVSMQVQVLDFMFAPSPCYELIKEHLAEKIGEYFRERKRQEPLSENGHS